MGAHDFKARNCQYLGRNIYLGEISQIKKEKGGFPAGSVVKHPPTNAEDTDSIPDLGRSHMPLSN